MRMRRCSWISITNRPNLNCNERNARRWKGEKCTINQIVLLSSSTFFLLYVSFTPFVNSVIFLNISRCLHIPLPLPHSDPLFLFLSLHLCFLSLSLLVHLSIPCKTEDRTQKPYSKSQSHAILCKRWRSQRLSS